MKKSYLAELIGTFLLVFIGCGSAVFSGGSIGAVGVALAFGITLLVLAYALGPISGCHVNPAVTLGMLAAGRTSPRDAVGYWVAQIIGGVMAGALVLGIAQGMPGGYNAQIAGLAANGYGLHSPGGFSAASGFFLELILTGLLVMTVLAATDVKAPVGFAGIAIGLALFLGNLLAIPVTNASINPARSIGPAVFVGGWAMQQLWLFLVAPLLGSLCAVYLYKSVRPMAATGQEPLLHPEHPEHPEQRRDVA